MEDLRSPQYSHAISYPFAGIGGPDRAVMEGMWPHIAVNVFDCRPECQEVLDRLHGPGVTKCVDIADVAPSDWEGCQGLVSGPPCIDFTMMGGGAGMDGQHGGLFQKLLEAIKDLANRPRGKLRWICLENVWALTYNRATGNALTCILEWWAEHMPSWTELKVYRVDARDAGLAQRRTRVIMIAFEKEFHRVVGGFPDKIPTLPHMPLVDALLDVDSDEEPEHKITELQAGNIRGFMTQFASMPVQRDVTKKLNHLQWQTHHMASSLAVVDASRRPLKRGHSSTINVGYCPTLTTKNKTLHVIGRNTTGRHPKLPSCGHRPLKMQERAMLSGVVWESVSDLQTPAEMRRSFGNIIPVDLAGCVLAVIMDKWARFEAYFGRIERPPSFGETPPKSARPNMMRLTRTLSSS